jgi:hypothetical protein
MDFDQVLENRSFAAVRTFTTMDKEGYDVCLTVAKIAFALSSTGQARLTQRPVRASDIWDFGTLRFPDDLQPEKPGTDIGLIGTAHGSTRESRSKNSAFAWLQVGKLRKVIQIFGPRHYRSDLSISEPGPLGPTPLKYELAYGGRELDGSYCEQNPVGVGYTINKAAMNGKPAPQLEPVYDVLSNAPKEHPSHATFGPIAAHWAPRCNRMGTRDMEYLRDRFPVEPVDFDPCFWNWSTPGLYSKEPLAGDEPVEVAGVLPEGVWRFKIPHYPMRFEVVLDDTLLGPPTHLDGLLIDADERVIELTYRVTTRLPLKWERLTAIRAIAMTKLPKEMFVDEPWPRAS